jgi:hypothetical protein
VTRLERANVSVPGHVDAVITATVSIRDSKSIQIKLDRWDFQNGDGVKMRNSVTDLKADSEKVIGSNEINLKISHLKINISQYPS